MNKAVVAGLIAVILVIIAYAYFTSVPNDNVLVALTDPPVVPAGTQALYINYSSVSVGYSGHNASGIAVSTAAGSVNLMSLSNSSIILAGLSIPNGANINFVKFNVSSSSILINGASYPVFLPSGSITVNHLSSGSSVVNGTITLLLDLSPTVISVNTSNNTRLFILVPSVKAISVGRRPTFIAPTHGSRSGLTSTEREDLEHTKVNISIVGASVSTQNSTNNTLVSVKVTDDSNTSVVLKHVLLFGAETLFPSHKNDGGGDANQRGVDNGSLNNSTVAANRSSESDSNHLEDQGRVINFFVGQNGSLYLPFNGEHEQDTGFSLQPGGSVVLTFSGKIFAGDSHVFVSIVSGASYMIIVQGEDGARAAINSTAG